MNTLWGRCCFIALLRYGDGVVLLRYYPFTNRDKAFITKELVGGGLLSSSGGCGVIKTMSKSRIHLKGDGRILGNRDFVKEVLAE